MGFSLSISGALWPPGIVQARSGADQVYTEVKTNADKRYQKRVQKVVVLRAIFLNMPKGEVVVWRPIFSPAIWGKKMQRLHSEKSKALIPAGPRGNHDQKIS